VDNAPGETNYRWRVLILAALTSTLAMSLPQMCMPVLFSEIAEDLNLSLVQVGLVWGLGPLAGVATGLVGGAISDQLGARRTLYWACLLVGPAGALRGLANDLVTLAAASFLFGLLAQMVMMNLNKSCGFWFPQRQLGLANGVIAMGAALGFMVTSMISATLLSPWLGGWRHVLFFYGAIAMLMSVPWYWSRPAPSDTEASTGETGKTSLRQTMAHVLRIRNVWLLGLVLMGIGSCVEGTLGYLPLYLRGLGWPAVSADGAASTFHALSMVFVIPMALWSDKVASRKTVLMAGAVMIMIGVGLLSVVDGKAIWGAVGMAGFVRDGFMAVMVTMLIETEGVGARYAGTAGGLLMALSGLGRLVAPPLGNSLAEIAPDLPFLFWSCLAAAGLLMLFLVREKRGRVTV
jgi:MFS family permease